MPNLDLVCMEWESSNVFRILVVWEGWILVELGWISVWQRGTVEAGWVSIGLGLWEIHGEILGSVMSVGEFGLFV